MQKRPRQTRLPGMDDDEPQRPTSEKGPKAKGGSKAGETGTTGPGGPTRGAASPGRSSRGAGKRSSRSSSEMERVEPSVPVPGTLDPGVNFKDELLEMPLAVLPEGVPDGVPDLRGKTVYAVDAASLIFQVFHAIAEMTNPLGQPVNAVFGFTRDIFYLLEQKQPDYLFCAFDLPGATIRHDQYEEYKAHRDEMPDELAPQIGMIIRMLQAMDVPILAHEGYEADDVLATLARQVEEHGGECILVTNDKDCRQLITDHVRLYNVRKDQIFDREALEADWGIRPDQVVDFQALVGDSVDNVPGVPLIGPKIAKELLQEYGTLDEVLARAGEVRGKKRSENLQNFKHLALLSRDLVRLHTDLPLRIDWKRGETAHMDREAALPLFEEWGFHGFANKVRAELDARHAPSRWETQCEVVEQADALAALVAQLRQQNAIAIRVRGTHPWPTWAELTAVVLASEAGQAYYIPIAPPNGSLESLALSYEFPHALPAAEVLPILKPLLEDEGIAKIGHNLKYDTILLRQAGVKLAGQKLDLYVASYLLDAGERNHSLEELTKRYLRHTLSREDAHGHLGTATSSGTARSRASTASAELPVHEAAAQRVDALCRLQPVLWQYLEQAELLALYQDLERPLIDVLVELEINGIHVDRQRLAQLSELYTKRLLELEQSIYRLAGREFNIASPKQLQEVLFNELGFAAKKKTRTGISTEASVLEELALEHELPRQIIEYRQFAKLKGTYVDALPDMINPRTGRVHCSFNQAVTATGRLSSSDPNLQNIPIRTEEGREIRSAFQPGPEGWQLLAADYSQIELRILAHFCGDEALCGAFERDEDIHRAVAAEVYGVPLTEVSSQQRRNAKAVNFGIIYGLSPWGLAKQLGIEQDEAGAFIDAYFQRYPRVEEFLAQVLAECRAKGYVRTILGRRRAIHGVRSGVHRQRNLPERTAINTVVQGSAADIIKLAMIRLHDRLQAESIAAAMLLQIHDELVFEVADRQLAQLAALVVQEMSSVYPLNVPLKVDVSAGANWASLQPIP